VGTSSEASGERGARHPWTVPGVLRIGSQVTPNTLNPVLSANTTETMIDRLMFDVLISTDAAGSRDVPMLAAAVPKLENGGISRDGLTLTYHLRRNVRWSDGVPFTSKDVKFSWSAIMDPRNNVISQTGYALVRSADTPDPWTVIFHMKQRFSPAVDTLFAESDSTYNVVPEHILGKLQNLNNIAFNSAPVGTGPFVFKEWARGDHLTLAANPHYYLGAPKLKEIVIKFIPDENTELSGLRTHDLDCSSRPHRTSTTNSRRSPTCAWCFKIATSTSASKSTLGTHRSTTSVCGKRSHTGWTAPNWFGT